MILAIFSPLMGNKKHPKKITSQILLHKQTAVSCIKAGGKNFYYAFSPAS
jgi:hypothetical protein